MSNTIAYWNFQERKVPHIWVHILPQVSIPLSTAMASMRWNVEENFLVLNQIDVSFLLWLCRHSFLLCCVLYANREIANLQHWYCLENWSVVPRRAKRRWLVIYTEKHYLVVSYISTSWKILMVREELEHVTTGTTSPGCPPVLWISVVTFKQLPNTQSALKRRGENLKNFTINIYASCLTLMVSLKTAEEDVDVTDPTE